MYGALGVIYRNYGFCIGAIIVSGWISCLTLYGKTNSSISCTVESRATFHVRFKRLYAVGLSPLARTGSVVGIFESLPLIVVPNNEGFLPGSLFYWIKRDFLGQTYFATKENRL